MSKTKVSLTNNQSPTTGGIDDWRAQKAAQEAAEPDQTPKAKAARRQAPHGIIEQARGVSQEALGWGGQGQGAPAPSGPSQGGRMLVVDKNGMHGTVQPVQSYNPAQLVSQAIQAGADVEVIERLGDMAWKWHERAETERKRQAFDRAMARAQAEFSEVKKSAHVKYPVKNPQPAGPKDVDYWHETLADVIAAVKPALNRHGLFYRFVMKQDYEKGQIAVTCVMMHEEGHAEENTLMAAVDTSSGKNHFQAIGSASTYLQRYTLKPACGLAAEERDDDGRDAGALDPNKKAPVYITAEQTDYLYGLMERKGRSHDKILGWAKTRDPHVDCIEHMTPQLFEEAVHFLDKLDDVQP